MAPYFGEFFGTALLVLMGCGVNANVSLARSKGQYSGWIVICAGWALGVFVAVWCFGSISGAHINPAVTLGLAAAGKFEWLKVPGYMVAQLLGGIGGATLVWLVYADHFEAEENAGAKLGVFSTAPAIRNYPRNAFTELVGTFVLVLAVLLAVEPSVELPSAMESPAGSSLGSPVETTQTAPVGLGALGALPTGLLVLGIGLCLGGPTGWAINPARDLGPRIAHAILPIKNKGPSDWAYSWVPVAGPLLGGLLAAALAAAL